MSSTDFTKVAFITGTNSGIGKSLVKEFNQRKVKVYASDVRFSEETSEEFKNLGNIYTDIVDVTNLDHIIAVRDKIAELEGKIDYLYLNAGIVSVSHATDVTDEQIFNLYNINLFSNMKAVREFVRLVINAKGTIIFSGSITKFLPLHSNSLYVSSKAALDAYAHTLQLELRGYQVRVLNVLGGYIKTRIFDSHVSTVPESSIYNFPEYTEIYAQRNAKLAENAGDSMETDVFAKRVLDQIQVAGLNQVNIFEGTKSSYLYYVSRLLSTSLLFDKMLNIFGLKFDYRKHLKDDKIEITQYLA
ncbi:hypothetical protein WICPIJ_007785 [Wickerhamomyces pijperi]|uniref:Uncharacterized protein n=1 Tax=Wickerhamomyces pijperi TaxID=599730 RepID=A0A9P8TK41_WICPI|nr:hypothetical protein WICPIJ_007785 [Wickerhamomyces pijperi]